MKDFKHAILTFIPDQPYMSAIVFIVYCIFWFSCRKLLIFVSWSNFLRHVDNFLNINLT